MDVQRTGVVRPAVQPGPSLHASLAVILFREVLRAPGGVWRWLLGAWFVLIVASALTTYQHHFIDIPAGICVGMLCMAGVGGLYLSGAGLLATAAIAWGGWAWWLLWPSGSLALVESPT